MNAAIFENISIDKNKLHSLGFNDVEIGEVERVYYGGGKFSTQALQSYGYSYEQAQRLRYIYCICAGKIVIDSKEDLIRHLKKIYGHDYKISLQDLAVSKVQNVPQVAVIANIMEEPYNIWNSNQYKGLDSLYKVVEAHGQNITIETSRKPQLEYGASKKIPGVLEIKGVKQDGKAVVTFNNNYCRLCNRFVIVATLKRPEFHLGMYEILCFEGTKVYIFASNMGVKENVRYKGNSQRIYAYGIMPTDIQPKLSNVAKGMYQYLHGIQIEYTDANSTYTVVPKKIIKAFEDEA